MKKATSNVVLAGWGLWVLYGLVLLFVALTRHLGGDRYSWAAHDRYYWAAHIGSALIPALGGWLAWRLYLRPRPALAIWFVLVCLLLLWKFFIGYTIVKLLTTPGHSLGGAIAVWWRTVAAANAFSAIAHILVLALLLFSMACWPALCLKHRSRKDNPASSSPRPLQVGQALCAECHHPFSTRDMIQHGGLYVCPRCKPAFLQKLSEGVTV